MSFSTRQTVSVTTAADGSATVYSGVITGKIAAIHYVKTDFADTVDFAITAEATGETIWTEQNVTTAGFRAPRMAIHTTAGVAALYAGGGAAVLAPICLANDRVKFAITNGGDTKTGAFIIVTE